MNKMKFQSTTIRGHTCTLSPHDRGEHPITPLIGDKIILPIELSKRHALGVDGIILMEEEEEEKEEEEEEGGGGT